jgi:hypothetical protein
VACSEVWFGPVIKLKEISGDIIRLTKWFVPLRFVCRGSDE